MSFSTELARLVSDQISRFVSLNKHQLAGQAANLDFWLDQVLHAFNVIDGYGPRFVRMSAAQEQYVAKHNTIEIDLDLEFSGRRKAAPPKRVPDHDLRKARRSLTEVTIRFLERCRNDGLISEEKVDSALKKLRIDEG